MKSLIAAAQGKVAVFNLRRWLIVGLVFSAFALGGCRGSALEDSFVNANTGAPAAQASAPAMPDEPGIIADTGTATESGTPADTDTATSTDTAASGSTGGATTAEPEVPAGDTAGPVAPVDDTVATDDTAAGGTNEPTPIPTIEPTPIPVTGSIRLSWRAPSERENGDALPLSDIGGYRIYYGPVSNPTANKVDIDGPATTVFELKGITAGTYQVAVSAFDRYGVESALSNSMSKTIQ